MPIFWITVCLPWVIDAPAATPSGDRQTPLGIEETYRLDLLPRLKKSVKVGMVSSYDRSGGNDDGFSGKYSFLRKEDGGLVIADLQGPGMIYRIHAPLLIDDPIEFYFDGEASPRIRLKFSEVFEGTHAPFLAPLVSRGAGGHYSYVPIGYKRSCKIVVKAEKFYFYQINYAQFPNDSSIETYQSPVSETFLQHLEKAKESFSMTGSDITSFVAPPGAESTPHKVKKTLPAGQSVTLFETTQPGRIVGLKLRPAAAFAGSDRDILIRMYWDGDSKPAVASPVGDLFGYSFGDPASRSLLFGTSEGTNYMYFPMPYEKSARIDLVSERAGGPPLDIEAEVITVPVPKSPDEGRFYALWRRENPTREGVPFTFLKTSGRGHVVGSILQAQGKESGTTEFFEGDDRAIIDGQLAIPGTGSEDSYNGGWYDVPGRWEDRTSLPLSGCLDYKKPLGRTGGYRLMLTDAYAYRENIDFNIEHSPEGNRTPTDYAGVVFFYSQERPTADFSLPPAAARAVGAPEKVIFVPGWNTPIHSWSFHNATLEKKSEKIGEKSIRYLSLRAKGEDILGPHSIAFILDIPASGKYEVGLEALQGPDQGIVQIFQNEQPAGPPINLYAAQRKSSAPLPAGTIQALQGNNTMFVRLVGKDSNSGGLGLDLIRITLERAK